MKTEIIGLENVLNKLTRISGATKDLTPAFSDMEGIIVQEFKANFPARGGNLEVTWPPRKRQYPWPILQKTGKMKGAWESKPAPQELTIRNTAEYATYHHFGSAYLPVRKLVGGTTKIAEIAKTRIEKFIKSFF